MSYRIKFNFSFIINMAVEIISGTDVIFQTALFPFFFPFL